MMAYQEKAPLEVLRSRVMTKRTLERVFRELPLSEADVRATGARSAFYQQWLAHNAPGDAYWPSRGFSENVAKVTAPVHLIGGFYDIFLPWQILDYHALRSAGRAPYLTIGPWVHASPGLIRASAKESLIWLQAHVLGDRRALREAPVRVFVTGADAWRISRTGLLRGAPAALVSRLGAPPLAGSARDLRAGPLSLRPGGSDARGGRTVLEREHGSRRQSSAGVAARRAHLHQ